MHPSLNELSKTNRNNPTVVDDRIKLDCVRDSGEIAVTCLIVSWSEAASEASCPMERSMWDLFVKRTMERLMTVMRCSSANATYNRRSQGVDGQIAESDASLSHYVRIVGSLPSHRRCVIIACSRHPHALATVSPNLT